MKIPIRTLTTLLTVLAMMALGGTPALAALFDNNNAASQVSLYVNGSQTAANVVSGGATNQTTYTGFVNVMGGRQLVSTDTTVSATLTDWVGSVGALGYGVYNSSPVTVTNGNLARLQTDANGYLKVNVAASASGGDSVNVAQVAGTTVQSAGISNAAPTAGMQDVLSGCRYNATLPTLTTTRVNTLQCSITGSLFTTLVDVSGNPVKTIAGNADGSGSDRLLQTASSVYGYDGSAPARVTEHSNTLDVNLYGKASAAGDTVLLAGAIANVAAPASLATSPVCQYNRTLVAITDTRFNSVQCDGNGYQAVASMAAGTPETASSGNVANSNAVATLATASGRTTYITGFQCTATGSTSGTDVTVTVAGVVTGTMSYAFNFPIGAVAGAYPLVVHFTQPVPASTTNTTIVVTLPAGGTGNTNAACSAQGFIL